jgi:CRISPR-associated protein Cas1
MLVNVSEAELVVRVEGHTLAIRKGQKVVQSLPLSAIHTLVLHPDTTLPANLLMRLTSQHCNIVIAHSRYPVTISGYCAKSSHARLRLRWTELCLSGDGSMLAAKRIVKAKCRRQLRAIQQLHCLMPTQTLHGTTLLNVHTDRIDHCTSLPSLMGVEGSASVTYFQALRSFLPDWAHSKKRSKRPPQDPFNALLSLTYTLATQIQTNAAIIAGFDPAIGVLHQPKSGRPSFSCDAMEFWRAYLDKWILTDVLPVLSGSHFTHCDPVNGVRLTTAGKQRYYRLWHKLYPRLHRISLRAVYRLRNAVLHNG